MAHVVTQKDPFLICYWEAIKNRVRGFCFLFCFFLFETWLHVAQADFM